LAKVRFLGLDFDTRPRAQWFELLAQSGGDAPFRYLVTPNVDHVVSFHEGLIPPEAYRGADYMVCDSRILAKLAAFRNVPMEAMPGSDMVRDFMADPASKRVRIGVFGPALADFARLQAAFPEHQLLFIEAPMMKPGSAEWAEAIGRLRDAPFDLLLCCISFPKQELICHDLKAAGRAHGLAVCAGASLDFLTGKQVRAPRWMMALYLEWLHRLLSDPKRLWYRYLVRGPRIFGLVLREARAIEVAKSN
jgi:N-acetylglucosaminyldiphosphoundecaprenol N-acetyl-beta-D-mannosaminyltransferase